MNNVYLIGMMGSGKSVTGKKLAAQLGYSFVDLDDLIQERTRRTIVDIFEKEGEKFFREAESAALNEAAGVSRRVIATGGGTVLDPKNVERMRSTGKIVYLETSSPVLWRRVREKKDRPLLKHPDPAGRLAQILEARRPLYEEISDLRVTTDGRSAEAVAREIFEQLEQKK